MDGRDTGCRRRENRRDNCSTVNRVGGAIDRDGLAHIGLVWIPGVGGQLLLVPVGANHVANLLALGPHASLVLIRKAAEAKGNRGGLDWFRLDTVILGI